MVAVAAAEVTISTTGRVAVVAMVGEVDIATAPALREALVTVCDGAAVLVVVDFAEVTFADSAALAVLVAGHKRLERMSRQLMIVNVGPQQMTIFTLTGLQRLMDVRACSEALPPSVRQIIRTA